MSSRLGGKTQIPFTFGDPADIRRPVSGFCLLPNYSISEFRRGFWSDMIISLTLPVDRNIDVEIDIVDR